MATLQFVILQLLLKHDQGMYGLELVKKSNGVLKRGSIYVTLDRMEDDDLIRSEIESSKPGQKGPCRRIYRITHNGKKVRREWEIEFLKKSSILGLGGV